MQLIATERVCEYKITYDWLGNVILWELCKKFKFDHMNKWYMHNPVSVLKNETHKLQWDFNIQIDHLISARRPDLVIIEKKKRTWKLFTCLNEAEHYFSHI